VPPSGRPHIHRADTAATAAAALLLLVAAWCGGGSRGAGDAWVHLATVPALALLVWRWRWPDASRAQRALALWALAAIALFALQLLPLPAAWFAALPGRAAVLADLHAAGLFPRTLPLSLDRWGTLRGLLACASFATMALLAGSLRAGSRRRLLQLALLAAVPLLLLGFVQAAAGHQPVLRFHPFHNAFGATATFANRNHFADFAAMLLPPAVAFARLARAGGRRGPALAWQGGVVLLLLAAALTYSRAGVALAVAAALAAWWWIDAGDARTARLRRHAPMLATALVAAAAIGVYAWQQLLARFDADPLADLRRQYLRYGLDAARQWWPWGTGAGAFPAAYAPHEPISAMVNSFALHAHDDVLEVAIEAGLPGLLLLAALLGIVFAGMRNIALASPRRRPTMTAAAISACVPLAHSLVDYPLRTLAVAVLFGLLLGELLAPADSPSSPGSQDDHTG
jgi:O-antigen ligase